MNQDPSKLESEQATALDEQLDDAVENLLQNKRNSGHPLTASLGMALRLKLSKEKPKLRADFDSMTEKMLLKEFAQLPRQSFWQAFWKPVSAGLVFGALFLAVLSPLFLDAPSSQTVAEIQDFEALSEAEVLLGSLPADAKTEEGIPITELRLALHELSLLRQKADLSLDEEGEPGSFPHTELRDNALEIIVEENRLVAMVDITVDIGGFADKVSEWPISNAEVDYETHAMAVNGYKNHAKAWDEATMLWAQSLVSDLK